MAGKYANKCRKLGEKIVKQTWARGWSGRRLASEFPDQSVSTVNRWTNDPDSTLAAAGRVLLQLSDTFSCSIDYLLRDEVEDPMGACSPRSSATCSSSPSASASTSRSTASSGPRA